MVVAMLRGVAGITGGGDFRPPTMLAADGGGRVAIARRTTPVMSWRVCRVREQLDACFCRRLVSESILSSAWAIDDETFPGPVADVCEVVVLDTATPGGIVYLVARHVLALVLPESLGQPIFANFLALGGLRLVGTAVFRCRSPSLSRIGSVPIAIGTGDRKGHLVVNLRSALFIV
ncbi:uncharacterized protein PG986_002129 [Apiospora aurea]|uniref:Uncharacterized protein n=1 Tax=Apiospora aurea TaxID=335848 RepID=A0ABR1QYS7_9PEZI